MELTINGERREYSGGPAVGDLLRFLGINPKAVAIERNLRILLRSEIENEPLEEGDRVEIIRMIGGG
ncbi:MAG: sulfur carrier protein ThiS [Desulfobacteraceae bacterium]|nr:sulfur carrier protein ThiS [Desulfobacteraceae bacterium]